MHQKKKDGQTVRGLINPEKELKKWFVDAHTNEEFMMDAAPDEQDVILVGKYRFSLTAFNRAQLLLETECQFPNDWFCY